jgi:hypothetical protein
LFVHRASRVSFRILRLLRKDSNTSLLSFPYDTQH